MSEEHGAERQAAGTPQDHCSSLEPLAVSAEYLRRAIAMFSLPNTTHETVARLVFDGRANVHTVKAWRTGKRYLAPWARELLLDKATQVLKAMDELPRGPGMRAGDKNLIRRYR